MGSRGVLKNIEHVAHRAKLCPERKIREPKLLIFNGADTKIESPAWCAVYTRHQHEKTVGEMLESKGFEVFLPLYNSTRKWKDRPEEATNIAHDDNFDELALGSPYAEPSPLKVGHSPNGKGPADKLAVALSKRVG